MLEECLNARSSILALELSLPLSVQLDDRSSKRVFFEKSGDGAPPGVPCRLLMLGLVTGLVTVSGNVRSLLGVLHELIELDISGLLPSAMSSVSTSGRQSAASGAAADVA